MALTPAQIVASHATVSDKIRALDSAGYPRAEIARLLAKRYQHVRNVLEADKIRSPKQHFDVRAQEPSGVEEGKAEEFVLPHRGPDHGSFFRLLVGPDGGVYLPAEVCRALAVGPGDVLVGKLDGKDFSLTDGETSMRRAQQYVRRMIAAGGGSVVDELIADRRREAAEAEANG
jgi:hypothetical protein